MSEAFDRLLEQQKAQAKQGDKMQRLLFIALIAIGVVVMAFIIFRGDPSTQPVDVNKATVEQLSTLPGVGPEIAKKIIKDRPYSRPEDLLKVPGIGEKTLEKMKPRLKFEAK
jgi:competence protein ComEA